MNKQKGFLRLTLVLSILSALFTLVVTTVCDIQDKNTALPEFRRNYPEYNDLSDHIVLERIKDRKLFKSKSRVIPNLFKEEKPKIKDYYAEEIELSLRQKTSFDPAKLEQYRRRMIERDKFLLNPSRWILYPLLTFTGIWILYAFIRWVVIAFIVRQVIIGFIVRGFRGR